MKTVREAVPTIQVPDEYKGREQTYIKHRVLQLYLQSWAQKLASFGSYNTVRIWYVDCFSGPWKSESDALEDTSIHIGLNAIQEAAGFWRARGCNVQLGAIFVEKNKKSFAALSEYLVARKAKDKFAVDIHTFEGEFGSFVPQIDALIKDDPAFLFVDPTGWNGAAMSFIAPLASKRRRDVMVNLMYDYINRFKEAKSPRLEYVREQLKEFFGMKVPLDLDEEGLMRLYREQLKKACGFSYAADLVVQDPCRDRTYFRLVLGAHHEEALKLFRSVQQKVLGLEAPYILSAAREEKRAGQYGQPSLIPPPPLENVQYERAQQSGVMCVEDFLREQLSARGPLPFGAIRLPLLEECHMTEGDLKGLLWNWRKEGRLNVQGVETRDRSIKDGHTLVSFLEKSEVIPTPFQADLFTAVSV